VQAEPQAAAAGLTKWFSDVHQIDTPTTTKVNVVSAARLWCNPGASSHYST